MRFTTSTRRISAAALGVALALAAPALASPLFYEGAEQFISAVSSAAAATQAANGGTITPAVAASVTPAQIVAGNTTGFLFYACTNPNQIALTFDDGPQPNHAKIRTLLDQYGFKGTFFLNGYNFNCIYDQGIPESIQQSYQEGHQIASHTWGHDDITVLTPAQLNNQMQLVENAFMKILGIRPAMFRPPYGNFNNGALSVIAARNYTATIVWDTISGAATGMNVQQSLQNYNNAIQDGKSHIILQHEQDDASFDSIYPVVFKQLAATKKQMVTVAQCLNMKPYLYESKIGTRDSTWTCNGMPGPGQPGKI